MVYTYQNFQLVIQYNLFLFEWLNILHDVDFFVSKAWPSFPMFFRNDIGFPCWFFLKWFVWARTPIAHSWRCFQTLHPNFGEDIPDYNWLGGWPPSFSVRTTTFRSNRSVQRRQVKWVMGDFRTPGGSPVGWFRKQALCECDDAWLGDSISFGKLSMKSCTM